MNVRPPAAETAGYDAALFAAHGGDAAERSFWARGRQRLIIWALRRFAPDCRTFCEIGCGTGAVLAALEREFPSWDLVGAEFLIEGLHESRRRLSRAHLVQMDATQLPFRREFDAIGAFDVIEHIVDDRAVLASMAAAIRPGGTLLVTVPQHPFLFGPADVAAHHARRYVAGPLVSMVESLGLSICCMTSFVALLFPFMAAVRLMSKWRGGEYDSADEFRIGPLNPVFSAMMSLERWTIERGMRWPFGGSLLLVARKPLR